jgi:hypothetical protein
MSSSPSPTSRSAEITQVEKQVLFHLLGEPIVELMLDHHHEHSQYRSDNDGAVIDEAESIKNRPCIHDLWDGRTCAVDDIQANDLCNLLTLQQEKFITIPRANKCLLEADHADPHDPTNIAIAPNHQPCTSLPSCSITDACSVDTDEEVRVDKRHWNDQHHHHQNHPTPANGEGIHNLTDKSVQEDDNQDVEDDPSSSSSWDIDEGGFRHYDTWTVLTDEYASDFGFGFSANPASIDQEKVDFLSTCMEQAGVLTEDDTDNKNEPFRILGTSMDDTNAHPHVLSPPLMASINQFLPESIMGQNFWLKYSLIRDGACMSTLLRYVRAAQHTIVAVETSEGQVLGSFTSSAWKTHPQGYFGSGEAFVWNMRYSRMTPCFSLYDQAQLESDVDIFPFSTLNSYVQLCTPDMIAVGGGTLTATSTSQDCESIPDNDLDYDTSQIIPMGGFAIMIQNDFQGFTGPSATFRNPCLIQHSSRTGKSFQIVNMEVWTLTPCMTVEDAEKLEMRKFFIEESVDHKSSSSHSLSTRDHHHNHHLSSLATVVDTVVTLQNLTRHGSEHSGSDYSQQGFYRRVGESENHDDEVDRETWT